MFEIWTIDKKITNIDGSHNLEKRTKVPLELTEAHAVALKYSRLGHIIAVSYTHLTLPTSDLV